MKRLPLTVENYRRSIATPPLKTMTRRIMRKPWPDALYQQPTTRPAYFVGDVVALTLPHWRNGKFVYDEATCEVRCEDAQDMAFYGRRVMDPEFDPSDSYRPCPAFLMPVWTALHFARIEEVRCERVQDISPEDAAAEGCVEFQGVQLVGWERIARFFDLWDSIHGEGAHADNPWVWVYRYALVERPANRQPSTVTEVFDADVL